MSWLTPFQNLIIRFKVGSGGGSGGGITEEYLNSKLAAFYTATETKLLNIVNSKLDTYVLKTDFTTLNATVTQLQEKVNNLPSSGGSGAKLSKITGHIKINDLPTTLSNLTQLATGYTYDLQLPNGATTTLETLKKYIVSYQAWFETFASDIGVTGTFIPSGNWSYNNIGENSELGDLGVIFLTNNTTPQTPKWPAAGARFEITLILTDTIENLNPVIEAANKKANLFTLNNKNTLYVKSWVNIGGD